MVVLGGGTAALVAGVDRRVVVLLTAAVALGAWWAARPLGLLAQRWLTVSTGWDAASVKHVYSAVSSSGDRATFLVTIDVA